MPVSRRHLIRSTAVGAGVLAVGNVSALFGDSAVHAAPTAKPGSRPRTPSTGAYGDLVPDPAGVLDLPVGFKYSIISAVGTTLINGQPIPDRFDGTACFAGTDKRVAIVRNHEQSTSGPSTVAAADPSVVFDAAVRGGTSTVILDRHGNKLEEYVSLAGTDNNCAGGATPWGTWLSCEETESIRNGVRHGWVFEVDPWNQTNNAQPTPLTALGRFAHEAAVIDPRSGDVYLSEDASGPFGLMYRCVPTNPAPGYANLRAGGELFAMACSDNGAHVTNLHAYATIGATLDVTWVAVPDPSAATISTRRQLADGQVTRSQKFEGLWYGDGKVYIVCSYATGAHNGQVWSYDPLSETLTLEVRFDVNTAPGPDEPGADAPDSPDNITVSPWGGLILAEDGEGVQHLLAVAPDGSTSLFARNHGNDSEFTGPCFSPDGKTLYANVQAPGVTFAITGPFARINRAK